MNLKRGLRRITLILAILVGVICGGITIGLLIDERSSALWHLARCEEEFSSSIPVADPNERPDGWPKRSIYEDRSDYLQKLYMFLDTQYANLPLLSGEQVKKLREEHDIPPDSPNLFPTEESFKFVIKYGSCVKKGSAFWHAHRSFWSGLPTIVFIGMLVLAGSGSTLAGFCGVWLIYKLFEWLVIGFQNEKPKESKNNK